MSIFEKLTSRITDKRKVAAKRYIQVLKAGEDELSDTVADELGDIVISLNISPVQIKRDMDNLKAFAANRALGDEYESRKSISSDAHNKAKVYKQIMESKIKEMESELQALGETAARLSSKTHQSDKARNLCEKMKREYPYLFNPDELIDIMDGKHNTVSGYQSNGAPIWKNHNEYSGHTVIVGTSTK